MMNEEFSLDPSFWHQLAPAWERTPVVIKNALPSPIASTAEVFEALCCCVDAANERTIPAPTVWLDGAELPTDINDFLPSRRDISLAGFADRLKNDLPDRDIGLYFRSAVHIHHADIGVRCREVLMSMPKHLGIPPGGVEVEVFCGQYKRNATGIHRDNSDNFSFVIDGKKCMLFWPEETFSRFETTRATWTHERVGTANYKQYLAQAICIIGEPGDVIYWPRSYWHMAISEEREWATTLNLAMWWNSTPLLAIARAMEQAGLLGNQTKLQAYPLTAGLALEDVASPEIMSAELDSFRNVVKSSELDHLMKETWAKLVTNGGLIQPPKPLPKRPLSRSDYVRGNARFQLVILPVDDDVVKIICAGNALTVRRCERLDGLVEIVRMGQTVRLDSLLKEGEVMDDKSSEPEKHNEQITELLEFLISNRALRIMEL